MFYANSAFANDVVTDVFKAFFLSHIFNDKIKGLKGKGEQEREALMKAFENAGATTDNFYGQVLRSDKVVGEIRF